MTISQPVLALINRNNAPVPTPQYCPATSSIADLLTASVAPSLQNTPPGLPSHALASKNLPAKVPSMAGLKDVACSSAFLPLKSLLPVPIPEPVIKPSAANLSSTYSSAPAAALELPKRKRGEMGPHERRAAQAAAQAMSEIMMAAVQAYIEKVDELVDDLAQEHGISIDRVCLPSGSKLPLAEIQNALHDDEGLMNILNNDKDQMKKLREEFKDGKVDKQKTVICVSTCAAALLAGKSLNTGQNEIKYINKSTSAWGFGVVACASYDSTIQSGFFGQVFKSSHAFLKIMPVPPLCVSKGVMIEGWPEDVDFGTPSKLKRKRKPVSDDEDKEDEDKEDGEDREADYQPKKMTSDRKRRRAADGNDGEDPVKKGKHSSNCRATIEEEEGVKLKVAVAPLTDKEWKLAALKKCKVIPGSKAAIAAAQFAETHVQLKEMHQENTQEDEEEEEKEEEEEEEELDN
ncbi:hypothetical protein BT96DRAFT_943304 [Gymnopus androsaceus JB14]|uniref:Uncharacterized protein n=1 Tax=Gymnopus androsaceus JB14 TaxID=1447944 RepID=A0A6A4H811_9AGAR|nr:hypothetical protein BT96DRAFT_943304 [Gymnopus androsaceus JB14]